jgi:hypothetical protein
LSYEACQLELFRHNSWGTAYQTIAEVQLLLEVGKRYGMSPNFARHSVSVGSFDDGNQPNRQIDFHLLGSYLNGQSGGTWINKVTFFFAVRAFLVRTEGVPEERLGREVYEVRQAMAHWGIFPAALDRFLPTGDPRASYRITPVRTMIRRYMAGPT